MFEYAITQTQAVKGTLTESTVLFDADLRRCYLNITCLTGAMYVSVHNSPGAHGIYVDTDNPLIIDIPITGAIRATPIGTSVEYVAVEGLS